MFTALVERKVQQLSRTISSTTSMRALLYDALVICGMRSPNIEGAATGTTVPMTKGKWLDAAVSMVKVQDVPSQVE